jgi:hypothetical protein
VSIASTVLPQNVGYICNGTSLDASSQLSIRKGGNGGFYGLQLNQLYSVNFLVPSSTYNFLANTNVIAQGSTGSYCQIDTTSTRTMVIDQIVLYEAAADGSLLPNTYKQFTTTFKILNGTIASIGTGYLTLKVLDPSTCETPTYVPPATVTLYTDAAGLTAFTPLTVTTVPTTGPTVSSVTATNFFYPSFNSFSGANVYSDPADWILLTLGISATGTGSTMNGTTVVLKTLIPVVNPYSV